MNSHNIRRLVFLVGILTMSSCGDQGDQQPPVASGVISPSRSALPEPVVPAAPQAPTGTPDARTFIDRACLDTLPYAPHLIDGTIVFRDMYGHQYSLMDLETGQVSDLGWLFPNVALSPDKARLAFVEEDTHQLKLVDGANELLKQSKLSEKLGGVIDWIDDSRLLIERFVDEPYEGSASLLLDIGTGELVMYDSDYSDMLPFYREIFWGQESFTYTAYDPTLSRVVYPSYSGRLTLWAIDEKQQVASWDDNNIFAGAGPQWFGDGSGFLFTFDPSNIKVSGHAPSRPGYDLFRISREGNAERLTYLTLRFEASIKAISLSPHESRVAFWMNLDSLNENTYELAYLDMITGEITNLCVTSSRDYWTQPVWSPDGTSLFVSALDADWRLSNAYVVDIARRRAYSLGGDIWAEEWLTKPIGATR